MSGFGVLPFESKTSPEKLQASEKGGVFSWGRSWPRTSQAAAWAVQVSGNGGNVIPCNCSIAGLAKKPTQKTPKKPT